MRSEPSKEEGGIVFAALMPHAPILIPDVGQEELKAAAATVAGMKLVAERLLRREAAAVVIISPHSPRRLGAFGIWGGGRLSGNLAAFGAAHVALDFPNDLRLAVELRRELRSIGYATWEISPRPLDHGALVPLWYLADAGWNGPIVVLSLNYPGRGGLAELGNALARAAAKRGQRVAIVASGDLSHRLTPNAPAGYDPRAREFDRELMACLRLGTYHDLERIGPELAALAGEDALDSTLIAAAAANWETTGHEVLSYEGPFGVGYGVAVLFDSEVPAARLETTLSAQRCQAVWSEVLPRVARESLKAALFETTEWLPPTDDICLNLRRGVFVTLRNPDGELRGCVGTVSPQCANVVEETRQMAWGAAFCDDRFSSITWEELPQLRFEVSVTGPLEEVSSKDQLDPQRYGVAVSTADGRRGCLLPGVPEVRTARQQIDYACLKGGIHPQEPLRLQRFEAAKCEETGEARSGGSMFRPMIQSDYPARWWTPLPDGRIECQLCPRACKLQEGQRGFCFVRQRINNELVLTTYGRSSGFCVDPMEKKPLNHFYPGTSVFSFGTAGCNLGCRFCQNWDISKAREFHRLTDTASPDTIARAAQRLGCKAVAFTYNDPVIFAEYAIDVAQACHALGIQTVAVTAGYMNPQPRAEFYRHIDAANVDLKGFTEEFYAKLCYGRLAPVLDTLEYLHRETNVWLEVTSLLIPGENDNDRQLHWAADWFAEHLGPDVPWHFTAFHPDYKMLDKPCTPLATLEKARAIALAKGLHYVYTGNVYNPEGSSTRCPRCQRVLIEREGYILSTWNLKAGCCRFCGCAIAGRFEDQPGTWDARRMLVRLN